MGNRTKFARTAIVVLLRAALMLSTSTIASAETVQEKQACIGDAFHFCSSAIPDRDQVFSCLTKNRDLISAACRSVIAPDMTVDQASSQEQRPRSSHGDFHGSELPDAWGHSGSYYGPMISHP